MNVVLDTNVLVSALWSPDNKPAAIVTAAIAGQFTLCYDYRILEEYTAVLSRPKFGFTEFEINSLLDPLIKSGLSVVPAPLSDISFVDNSDKKFYEVAKFCNAYLVTGNLKHFPTEDFILSTTIFFNQFLI